MTTGDGEGRNDEQRIDAHVLTRNAGQDSLSETEYREIYDELRVYDAEAEKYQVSLDAFVELIGSAFSKAAWSKYHRVAMQLNRTMRNELRQAVGLPVLPPTVVETMHAVDPDALVVQVGEGTADRVVLVAEQGPALIVVNGEVRAWAMKQTADAGAAPVTPVTQAQRRRSGVSLPPSAFERFNAVRVEHGLSWAEMIELAVNQLSAED